MAVAEKTVAEKTPHNPQKLLGLGSIVGAGYVLLSLIAIFAVLPALWEYLWGEVLQVGALRKNPLLFSSLLLVVEVGAAVLLLRGARGLEKSLGAVPGLRAGVFFACLLLILLLWVTHMIGVGLEQLFETQPIIGMVFCLAVAAGLFYGLLRLFLRPGFGQWLRQKEEQGWFHATTYKHNQGVRVRRGTVIGVLTLGICGIITLISHKQLGSEGVNQLGQVIENNWEVRIPFLGEPLDRPRVSLGVKLAEQADGLLVQGITSPVGKLAGFKENDLLVSMRSDNKEVSLDSESKLNQELIKYRPFEVVKVTIKRDGQNRVMDCPLDRVGDVYVTLLYAIHFTVPLVLVVLLLWVCWRLVNWPTFADFLIATEAEMNKVSWTTRRRLVQDTMVVLVTVVLLTTFLFVVDIFWVTILNHPWINVLQVDVKSEVQKQQEKTQW